MDITEVLSQLAELIQSYAPATLLAYALYATEKHIIPALRDIVLPVWIDKQHSLLLLFARAVTALEEIAENMRCNSGARS